MLDRRKRLVNRSEEEVLQVVSSLARERECFVFPKTRIADVLDLDRSGLSSGDYSYGLKAHFDFVVADSNYIPVFAVEYDGPGHNSASSTVRDQRKNLICRAFRFPLLRIGTHEVDYIVRRFTVLSWLVECWFLEREFLAAQERGEIPFDEVFDPAFILSESVESLQKDGITWPYDISWPARQALKALARQGKCVNSLPRVFCRMSKTIDSVTVIAVVGIGRDLAIYSKVSSEVLQFGAVNAFDVAKSIAICEVATKVEQYVDGNSRPVDGATIQKLVNDLKEVSDSKGDTFEVFGQAWHPNDIGLT